MSAVAVVGAGLIGTAIAKRLVAAGLPVAAYDVDRTKVATLGALGVTPLETLAEAAACDRAVLAVYDTGQVAEALLGAGGLAAAWEGRQARPVAVVVSTCDPEGLISIAMQAAGRGVALVECPLSGSSAQVAAGDGVGLVAGDAAAVASVDDVLEAIAPRRFVLPRVGDGAKAKLAVNLILGLNRAALAEGLVFAERLGLDPGDFLAVARGSAAYSEVMDVKGDKMLAGDFAPLGRIAQSHKDFSLIVGAAHGFGQALPLGETYLALVAGCIAAGEGELDNAAVINELRRRTSPAAA